MFFKFQRFITTCGWFLGPGWRGRHFTWRFSAGRYSGLNHLYSGRKISYRFVAQRPRRYRLLIKPPSSPRDPSWKNKTSISTTRHRWIASTNRWNDSDRSTLHNRVNHASLDTRWMSPWRTSTIPNTIPNLHPRTWHFDNLLTWNFYRTPNYVIQSNQLSLTQSGDWS